MAGQARQPDRAEGAQPFLSEALRRQAPWHPALPRERALIGWRQRQGRFGEDWARQRKNHLSDIRAPFAG